MSDAREEILASIGRAVPRAANDDWASIPREYRTSSLLSQSGLMELFKERLQDYGAHLYGSPRDEMSANIARVVRARNLLRIVIPHGIPSLLLPNGFDFVVDDDLSYLLLDQCDGVITLSTLAIAETGTIVLQSVPGQGRRAATLIPDYHLCVVEATRIFATVPEAIAQLRSTAHLPTTFVSGPSATADIEMTRIKGVHGPRSLDVLVVAD